METAIASRRGIHKVHFHIASGRVTTLFSLTTIKEDGRELLTVTNSHRGDWGVTIGYGRIYDSVPLITRQRMCGRMTAKGIRQLPEEIAWTVDHAARMSEETDDMLKGMRRRIPPLIDLVAMFRQHLKIVRPVALIEAVSRIGFGASRLQLAAAIVDSRSRIDNLHFRTVETLRILSPSPSEKEHDNVSGQTVRGTA